MTNWTPLHVHSKYSILDGLPDTSKIAKTCKNYGYNACALTDHGTIGGAVDFSSDMFKEEIKPILGNEFYVCKQDSTVKSSENRPLTHLVVLSKNKEGWLDLIQATSLSNTKDNIYYKPRLNLEKISQFSQNWIVLSGHIGTELSNCIFSDFKAAYNAKTESEVESFLLPNYRDLCKKEIQKHSALFKHFFVEIQLFDKERMPTQSVLADVLRECAKECGVGTVCTPDAHYCNREDAEDQRILLCSSLKTTLKKAKEDKNTPLHGFFESDKYYIPSLDEVKSMYLEEEISRSMEIADMCEEYKITGEPRLPTFPDCKNREEEGKLLKQLCREGWKKRVDEGKIFKNPFGEMAGKSEEELIKIYKDRVLRELTLFEEAKLEGYFLIVQDYINWARNNNQVIGPGRGSSSGSLVAYLLGITHSVDPLAYNLLLSRFFNAGRKGDYPDIDTDFPKEERKEVFEYLKNRYGEDRVAQIVTFGSLKGAGALKEVLRAHNACDNDTMNKITKRIPGKDKIEDKMEEAGEESILMYVLRFMPKLVSEFCTYENDEFHGDYAKYFEQAIRLEGCLRSTGKHAAGVIISPEPLNKICPMVWDSKEKQTICGIDMGGLKKMGLIKFDLLSLKLLSKLQRVNELLCKG